MALWWWSQKINCKIPRTELVKCFIKWTTIIYFLHLLPFLKTGRFASSWKGKFSSFVVSGVILNSVIKN